jgi:lysozyme
VHTNREAFLALIRFSEGTSTAPDPWRVCYGYKHTIIHLREHPAITGEWKGEPLSDAMCKAAGHSPGCVSTAAGAYQLIRPTWIAARVALTLKDFMPDSQDAAALWLIKQRGALIDVDDGRIGSAIAKCRRLWASFPGSGVGQPTRSLTSLLAVYTAAGGKTSLG